MHIDKGHRLPSDIISNPACLYHRFNLSHRDIETLLAERGVGANYESIRVWSIEFGPDCALGG